LALAPVGVTAVTVSPCATVAAAPAFPEPDADQTAAAIPAESTIPAAAPVTLISSFFLLTALPPVVV
jgi:hypothetical protein